VRTTITALLMLAASAMASNLLDNGSFETGLAPWESTGEAGLAEVVTSFGNPIVYIDTVLGNDTIWNGDYCLRLTQKADNEVYPGHVGKVTQMVDVSAAAGEETEFTGWVHYQQGYPYPLTAGAWGVLKLTFYANGTAGTPLYKGITSVKGGCPLKPFGFFRWFIDIPADADSAKLEIYPDMFWGPGIPADIRHYLLVDHLDWQASDPPQAPPLNVNGDFGEWENGVPVGWTVGSQAEA